MKKTAGRFGSVYQKLKSIPTSPFAKRVAIGAGMVGAAGAGAAGGAYLSNKNKIVYYTDSSKSTIRWNTYPGGPILEGPTQVMLSLFRKGRMNKAQGIKELAMLLKQGTVRKVGVVR